MKLPSDPESMRAVTRTETSKAIRWTIVVSGVDLTFGL